MDAATGKLIWKTQVETFPGAIVTSSPVVYNNVVYVGVAGLEEGTAATPGYPCCISRGSVVALDAWTGKIKWKTYMVPDNHSLTGGYSGGAVWGSTPVVDATRNSLYVGTGNNYSVPATVAACITATPMNKACTDPTDYFDSIMALDLTTGAVKWAGRAMFYDAWNVACVFNAPGAGNCPNPAGPDYDFGGSGPNLLTAGGRQLVGVGEKSGMYYALNPDTGAVVWSTNVGPGSSLGGIEWGTASDSANVYVPIANYLGKPYQLQPSGANVNGGSWSALDPATGKFKWQTATPGACTSATGVTAGCMALGPVSAAGGVVFGGSMDRNPADPTMFALDGKTGAVLWSYNPGSTVNAAPAIVGNSVYWGSGYAHFGFGTPNNYLFAFAAPKTIAGIP
jgi:polyvinyl alcohol dehydrogenase (cytochrome)